MSSNIIEEKSFEFALNIVKAYKELTSINEYVLSKQMLRSGTSIGANISEAERGQSKADFIAKMSIALKESNETLYWIRLLYASEYMKTDTYDILYNECLELIKMLTAIIKNSK